jgi:hypothetical protein
MSTICDNCQEVAELRHELDFYEKAVIQLKQMLERHDLEWQSKRRMKWPDGKRQGLSDALSIFEGEK